MNTDSTDFFYFNAAVGIWCFDAGICLFC